MEALEAIFTRHSVRNFVNRPVPEEDIITLLQAAMQAPSAGNAQPWHFIVITDRNLLLEVPKFHPHAESLHQAPVAILVCGDDKLIKQPDRWIMDCSAATQNILIAAHACGLGAVWLGIFPDPIRIDSISKLVAIPEHIHPLALVAVGYPQKTTKPSRRFRADRIHWNQW